MAIRKLRAAGLEGEVTALPRIPYASAMFDLVVCTEVLEHIDDAKATLAEFHRVLRPNGFLLLSVPDGETDREEVHVHRFTRQSPREMLSGLFAVRSIDLVSEDGCRTLFAELRKASHAPGG